MGVAPKPNKRSFRTKFWNVTQGTFLEGHLTLKNAAWVVAIVLFILLQGINSYTLLRSKKEISKLRRELTELRMEHVTVQTTLMGARRLSSIEERVQMDDLGLSIPKSPPILLDE